MKMEKKKIDALGRIVLPKSILRHLHWKNGDELLLLEDGTHQTRVARDTLTVSQYPPHGKETFKLK